MASIKKRKNAYQFSVSIGRDMNGKQILRYKTYFPKSKTPAAIRKEVELAAAEFEEQVKEGKYYDGENLTFSEFVKQWKKKVNFDLNEKLWKQVKFTDLFTAKTQNASGDATSSN